nr:type IX secretion system sortase PorU [Cytophagales bacterium]
MEVPHNTWLLIGCLWLGLSFAVVAQSPTLKFPVTEEGVYKITAAQASTWGLGGISGIGIFGQPGMLDQKLDTSFMDWKELPAMELNGDLFVFLSTADQIVPTDDNYIFRPHTYTDTIYYLIQGNHQNPLRITPEPTASTETHEKPTDEEPWLMMQSYKQETTNLLGSGRNWYGHRVLGGQQFSISIKKPAGFSVGRSYVNVEVMAQSLSDCTFELTVDQNPSASLILASIPNSTYGIKGREGSFIFSPTTSNTSNVSLTFNFSSADRNATGYLKHAIVGIPSDVEMLRNQVLYRYPGSQSETMLSLPSTVQVWDVSNSHNPLDKTQTKWLKADTWKVALFDPTQIPSIDDPTVADIGLKALSNYPEFIIVSSPAFLQQANRLAAFKRNRGMSTLVVTPPQLYDAHGYGSRDITAFRNYFADQFHQGKVLNNVLFFGKGTYDYKHITQGQPNLIPTYSSRSSLNPLTSYSSDDYFGFLAIGDGEWDENNAGDHQLQIGIGRIPAVNVREATEAVDKIIRYATTANTKGEWKSRIMLLADDGDNNIHLRDAETHAAFLQKQHPEFTLDKLYLDHYEQINTGNSQLSPSVKEGIAEWVAKGGLIINYIGHGNETTLAAERLWVSADLADWQENDRLALFVTATCEFGRHDSPFIRSGAEELLFGRRKGAIALLTTGRPVFSSINFELNKAFFEAALLRRDGNYLTLGEIFRITKNNSLNGPLNRNFSLLGDPSLTLNLPEYGLGNQLFTDIQTEVSVDTLQALQRIRYSGEITDPNTGALIPSFNGDYAVSLFDKPTFLETLGDESIQTNFLQTNMFIHRGSGKVKDGKFEGEMIVGKNIDYAIGEGIFRVFATDPKLAKEALGASKVPIGGSYADPLSDTTGPEIGIYASDSTPLASVHSSVRLPVILTFNDASGINISPTNIGQNLRFKVNEGEEITLNDLFRAVSGTYQSGYVKVTLTELREGINSVQVIAFDNQGNRSVFAKNIEVAGSEELRILSLTAYPNPAINQSSFTVTHNRAGENIFVKLTVYSVSGREIFSTENRFPNAQPSIRGLDWIFLQDKTKYPVKGTYIYHLELLSEEDGAKDQMGGKIIIR